MSVPSITTTGTGLDCCDSTEDVGVMAGAHSSSSSTRERSECPKNRPGLKMLPLASRQRQGASMDGRIRQISSGIKALAPASSRVPHDIVGCPGNDTWAFASPTTLLGPQIEHDAETVVVHSVMKRRVTRILVVMIVCRCRKDRWRFVSLD